jgi:hypothetical protein
MRDEKDNTNMEPDPVSMLAGALDDSQRIVPTPLDLSRLLCYSSRLSNSRHTIYTVHTLEWEILHTKYLFRVRMKPGFPS